MLSAPMATIGKPAFQRVFGGWDYIKISLIFFATTALWQSLHSIILPIRILDFVSESQKNTYLGLITFVGLVLAMLAQPVMGTLSDRSRLAWGRRRPFIFVGITSLVIFLSGIGLATSYAVLFASYCLMQLASNTAQGASQAFIPEMVPAERRGLASGVMNLMQIAGGAALVYVSPRLMARYSPGAGGYWLWLNLGLLGVILLLAMIATLAWVKEPKLSLAVDRTSIWKAAFGAFRIDLKQHRAFVWFLASRLLVFMALATVQQFALYFFRDVVGLPNPAQASANFLVVAVAGMLIVSYPAGRLSDRLGRKPVAVASALLGALAVALILVLPKDYGLLLAPAAVLGISLGAFISANWAMATDLVPPGEEARYLAVANMATAGGAALARLIGPVIDFFNVRAANSGYTVMLIVCLAYFTGGALLLLKVRPATKGIASPA